MSTAYAEYQRRKLQERLGPPAGGAPVSQISRTQRLPAFLGGGEVNRAATFPRPQSERGNYGGVATAPGFQRDHTIPFSLGGT
ncbi:MAG: hypothetical protein U1C53_00555, partial [Candidatus Veblenbacteria bacterium]|nr:hypothetical protein [Candidatus Veblenbacteria bacterium]